MEVTATTAAPARKEMQAAIKDINATLAPAKKLNIIGTGDFLSTQIVTAIAACIGQDDQGNPTWENPAAGNLSPDTIKTYEALVLMTGTDANPEPETSPTGEPEGDCAAWVAKAGPKEGDPECDACPDLPECTERAGKAVAKPAQPKKTDEEKEAEKLAKEQAKIEAQATKEKEKADKKAQKKAAVAAAKIPAEPKYSRVFAFLDALKAGGTKDDIASASNKLYMEKTGKADNLPEAKFWASNFLRLLTEMGQVQEQDGKISLITGA